MNVILELAIGFYIVAKLCNLMEIQRRPNYVSFISTLGAIVGVSSVIVSLISIIQILIRALVNLF
jgi:hypothetical protein